MRLCDGALHGELRMFTQRIERHQLPYFLRVFNSVTDKPIGFLGNLSEDGLMLISQLPMMVGVDFQLRLKIPASDGCQQVIDFTACCVWCHEDATPLHYAPASSCNAHRRSLPNWCRRCSVISVFSRYRLLPDSNPLKASRAGSLHLRFVLCANPVRAGLHVKASLRMRLHPCQRVAFVHSLSSVLCQ